ncbi:hypothetical protein ACHAWC_008313 [Mediolabrus comicus]
MVYNNTSSEASFVQDAASVAASRFQEVVTHIQNPETRAQFQAKVDFVVKTIFSPCVGGGGDIGGIPLDDMGGSWNSKDGGMKCPDAIPVEVSPNTSEENMNSPTAVTSTPFPESYTEYKKERSLAKLKKLGARHQLASGYVDPRLPDAARPVSPDDKHDVAAPPSTDSVDDHVDDEVDFDDGISAISAHTLEEMDKRQKIHEKKNTVRVNPSQFSSKSKQPPQPKQQNPKSSKEIISPSKDFSAKPFKATISGNLGFDDPFFKQQSSTNLNRVRSQDSQKLEKEWHANEENYWKGEVKKDNARQSTRRQERLSVEERARRLRELSRSRSRSSNTGSLGSSHPHETSNLISKVRVQVSRDSRDDVPMDEWGHGEI